MQALKEHEPDSRPWTASDAPRFGEARHQEMSARQIGHLRHIDNISRQPPGDWSHMGTKMPGQEDFGSYRFQLAFMAYAVALAHVHRAPNAPGAFRGIFERLITKMLHPDVWMYWRNVSQGGHVLNAHLRPKLKEEWDPVVQDNIMYSAYIHSMTLMYNALFGDTRYADPKAVTFEYISHFWGDGPKRFSYDQNSLNDHLYWKMVESGYLGIACEPNCVFQICNQPAILGFRLHDILTGGSRASEVVEGYKKTWSEFGHVGENGHFNMLVLEDSRTLIPNAQRSAWVDGWTGALMNTWNRDLIRDNYQRQIGDVLEPGKDGAVSVTLTPPAANGGVVLDYDVGDFGFVAIWASEMGDARTLSALTKHADRFMNPTWANGGFYYPRQDQTRNADGDLIRVEPITGNALLAYAALNVPDGMWGIFNRLWTEDHFKEPLITEISDTVDVLQAVYDDDDATLRFVLSPRADKPGPAATLKIENVFGRGDWRLSWEGGVLARGNAESALGEASCAVTRDGSAADFRFALEARSSFSLAWKAR